MGKTSPFKASNRPVSATPQCPAFFAAGRDSRRQTASEKAVCNNLILKAYFSHLERAGGKDLKENVRAE
ncbi:MAG: hypothetical protein R2941_24175 [Desulfobacterales bacterium]